MSDDDDAALSWAGDEERGREAPRIKPDKIGDPNDSEADLDELDQRERGTSGLLLVAYGILAGGYGIFTVGWITSVLASTTTLTNLPAEIMYQFGEFLAIALPALWFVAVLWLERRPPRRLLWLLVGVPLVLPWPWVLS